MTTIEEAHKYLQPALLHDKEHTDCGACALVADLMLTVLKKALSEKDKPHPFVCANPERECWGKPPCWVHKLIQQIGELGK